MILLLTLISMGLPLPWNCSPPLPAQQIAQTVHALVLPSESCVYFLTLLIWDRLLPRAAFPWPMPMPW